MNQQLSKPATYKEPSQSSSGDIPTASSTSGEVDFRSQKQRIDDLDLKIALSERASANHDQGDKSLPPLLVFPIRSDHPLIQDWPFWKNEVHTALDTCGIRWVSMGVLIKRRSVVDTGRQPTITVTVPGKPENVEEAKRMIEDICERNGHPLLNVEIRYGRIWR